LRGADPAPHAGQRHVEARRFQFAHRGQLIGNGKRIEHRGQPGIEYPVEGEYIDVHGKNDTKDVYFANSWMAPQNL
jgi:hypothetical protein